MKEISAGGVVYRIKDGRVEVQLILDRYGRITLAKGKIEAGETLEQTALREIEEETGIIGRLQERLDTIYYQYISQNRQTIDKEVHYYLVEAVGGTTKPQIEEINQVDWYSLEDAWENQKENGYDNNDSILQKALDLLRARSLSSFIDHTQLKPESGLKEIEQLCKEALEHRFYSVCVNSLWVETCRRLLEGSKVKISAVCGFPLGASASRLKAEEAAYCIQQGAAEIDMVLPIGLLREGNEKAVYSDIKSVVDAAVKERPDSLVKVILETGLLTDAQIQAGSRIAAEAGAHFVKTSTGFGPRGASEQDIRLMKQAVPPHVQIKASGGIRDYKTAARMIELGAARLGTSSGIAIIQGQLGAGGY